MTPGYWQFALFGQEHVLNLQRKEASNLERQHQHV
jgi:hypothetical protein